MADPNNNQAIPKYIWELAIKIASNPSLKERFDELVENDISYNREELWKESYYFNDFLNYWTKPENRFVGFDYKKKLKKEIIPQALKCIRIINRGGARFVVAKVEQTSPDRNPVDVTDEGKFKSAYGTTKGCFLIGINETQNANSAKPDKYWLFEFLYDYPDLFAYNDMDFVPFNPLTGARMHPKVFNTFIKFGATLVDTVNMELIQPILDHIKHCWSRGKEDRSKWINDFFAKSIQDPTMLLPILVLFGAEGCGKSILIQFILDYVWGGHCTRYLTSLDDVTGAFNSTIAHRYGICLAEPGQVIRRTLLYGP